MMMRGKVGAFSYYVSDTRQIVRQAQNNSNYGATATRSPQQQSRRVNWANLVNFYKGNKAWMKKSFENLKPGVSEFNKFMQLNINGAHVALTKEQARKGAFVIQPLQISEGSLPSITNKYREEDAPSKVILSAGALGDMTIAEVSQDILNNNSAFRNGDAIVFVGIMGINSAPGANTPLTKATYIYKEFVIDTSDTRIWDNVYDMWKYEEGFLACRASLASDTYVYIHTRSNGGKLYVSTETIAYYDGETATEIEKWGASDQMTRAVESYKVDQDVPLMPGEGSVPTTGNDSSSGGGGNPSGPGDGNLE